MNKLNFLSISHILDLFNTHTYELLVLVPVPGTGTGTLYPHTGTLSLSTGTIVESNLTEHQ
jgi:hypothetical protein